MATLHDELNQRIFDGTKMRDNVREALLKIVQEFLDKLNENEIPIVVIDYRLVGSNAAYNYTSKSDIDVHIIADLSNFKNDSKLLQLLYDYFKSNFNDKYDITVRGMDVELYIEDSSLGSISNGVYSIKDNEWIKKPKKINAPDFKVEDSKQYKDLVKQYQDIKDDEISDFIDNLYVIRKVSLSKGGEFAEGNLIFKAFRDNGYLDDLKTRQAEIKSKELSLESLEEAVSPQGYAPKKTGKAYKVFKIKNGKLYPPMVANAGGKDTPIGVWLDAEEGEFAGLSKTGRPKVKSTGGEPLAYRPGWHLGDIPRAKQFDRLNKETGEYEFPKDFVWAECDYAMDVDYQPESDAQGYMRTKMDDKGNVITYKSDKYQHSLAGLPKLPKDGYYKYRTNPNPDTVPWVITGQMKVNRLLSDDEVNAILKKNGIAPIHRQGGDKTLKELGLNESLNEGADLSSRYDDVVNAELSTMNKFLDEFGFEVELHDWKYGNYAGIFLNSIQDDASVFPIALNKKLIVKDSEDFTDLLYNIRGTLAHEVGHGLFEYLNDILDLDDLDEEDTVEDFAYCYEDRCLDESELYRILTHLDDYLDESLKEDINQEMSNEYDSEGNQLTKAQVEFFKNSKARDEQGRLLVLYHTSNIKNIVKFIPSKDDALGRGIYFSKTPVRYSPDATNEYACYLNITNPFVVKYPGVDTDSVLSKGYDGIVNDVVGFYVAFEPNQIKSITNLNPTNRDNINECLEESLDDNYINEFREFIDWVNSYSDDEISSNVAGENYFNDDYLGGVAFILPNGKVIGNDSCYAYHSEIIESILETFCEEWGRAHNIDAYELLKEFDVDYEWNVTSLRNWIKVNDGSSWDGDCYIVLSKKRPTSAQFETLEEFLDKVESKVDSVEINIYPTRDYKDYSFDSYTTDDIINRIKRYYASGILYENKLEEVYPNKGESKKDFIARFMSVTKDEYPDQKQRYAVANSYWERRNKKRVNESTEQIIVAYHGSQQSNLQLTSKPIYLTNDRDLAIEFANGYAFNYDLFDDDEPTLYTIKVRFNNPLIISTEDEYDELMDISNIESTIDMLMTNNQDGIIYNDTDGLIYYMPINARKQCEIVKEESLTDSGSNEKLTVEDTLDEATLMHWGDLDYGRKADRRAIMAGRGTGHFGTGFYFVSKDKYDDMHYDYNPERPIYELDTDSYHLFKPKSVDDAYALHDALKSINDYAREDNVELLGYFDKCDRMHRDLNKLEDKIGYEDGWENEVLEFTKKYGAPWLVDRVEYMIQAENWYDLERFPKRIYDAYVESHNEVRDAIRTIEKITRTYRDLESIIPKAASHIDAEDSISTEVMKALGFEGIDVSHLQDENGWQSPDNFTYGSVIYDLKPNTYRRVKEPRGDYSLKYKK